MLCYNFSTRNSLRWCASPFSSNLSHLGAANRCRGRYISRCERAPALGKALLFNVTFCTAISGLGNTFAFSHRGHTMARTLWVSPWSCQRACYVAQLIDEAVWWHNVMKAVSHARIVSDEKLESHREDKPTLQTHANAEKRAPEHVSPATFVLAVSFLRSHYWTLSEDII